MPKNKELPCVIAKSLIAKYQKNEKCKQVSNLVLPICGDKRKQIKLEDGGIRIPALFKKEVAGRAGRCASPWARVAAALTYRTTPSSGKKTRRGSGQSPA